MQYGAVRMNDSSVYPLPNIVAAAAGEAANSGIGDICVEYSHLDDVPDPRSAHRVWGRLPAPADGTFQIVIALELLEERALRWLG